MADNYRDTAYRMYDSSDVLYQKQQWFNANYLAGYILECYCKLALSISLGQGHSLSANRQSIREFSHKVSDLATDIHKEIEDLMDRIIKMELDGVLI